MRNADEVYLRRIDRLKEEKRKLEDQLRVRRGLLELTDPLTQDENIGGVLEYLQALLMLSRERAAHVGSRTYDKDQISGGGSFHAPMPRAEARTKWASIMIQQEVREMRRRAERLEDWLEYPFDPRKSQAGFRCPDCGRGGPRHAKFCAWCGGKREDA